MADTVRLVIDGRAATVPAGATILEAARRVGITVPTLCSTEALPCGGSCFLCAVEVEGRPGLWPACAAPAAEGLVVRTDSAEVLAARRTALELLLSDHTGDCAAPCMTACPARLDIAAMNRRIAAGDMAGALAVIRERIALPGVLGRVCARPCERVCRRRNAGTAIAICALKRAVAEFDRCAQPRALPTRRPPTGRRVAVIGAGPAGLSAAWFLHLWGHDCTLYDALPGAGGALRAAVPDALLPRAALEADIAAVLALGVQFRSGARIDPGALPPADAVLLATGAPAQGGPLSLLPEGAAVDRRTFAVDRPGLFAAGDLVLNARAAVRAVASGRAAAVSIDQYLSGRPFRPEPQELLVRMGRLSEAEEHAFQGEGAAPPRTGEWPDSPAREDAIAEARRCLQCDCLARDDCRLRQLATEHGASTSRFRGERRGFSRDDSHPAVVFEPGKCVACGLCVRQAEKTGARPGLTFTGRGFSGRVAVPFGGNVAAGLGEAALACAAVCPTGALRPRRQAGS